MPITKPPTPRLLALVLAGGTVGSSIRLGLVSLLPSDGFPWGVLAVNLAGAAVVGAMIPRLRGRRGAVAFWVVGVGGGATTFSTLTVDAVTMLEAGRGATTVWYLALSVLGGVVAATVGIRTRRWR